MEKPWYTAYEELTITEQERFTRVIHKLLGSTFIVRDKDETKSDFYLISKFEDIFTGYLSLAKLELFLAKGDGVYYIKSSGHNRLQLNMEESILLLIVRLIYERKKKELALSDKVVIQSADIQAEYRALNIKNRPITKESLRNFISLMKKYNLAESLDSNPVNPEHRLLIYPSIRYALPVEDIRQVYDRLRNYAKDPDAFNPEEDSNEDLNRY